MLQRLLVDAGSASTILNRLVQLVQFDLPDHTYDRIAEEVAGLTLGAFHPFVQRELSEHGQVFGAFGNRDAVDAAKRATGQPRGR